jgi:pimeloyl-ACP methyl ester carboxylesterase
MRVPPGRALSLDRRGAGPPLVLLHGIGGERQVWRPVLDELAQDFEVFTVDLPGFGASAPLDGETPTAAALAAAVARGMADLGVDAFHVAGNSLGGWVALELGRLGAALTVTGICPAGLWGAEVAERNLRAGPRRSPAVRWSRRLRPLVPALLAIGPLRRLILRTFVADPARVPRADAVRMVVAYGRSAAYDETSFAMRSSRLADPQAIGVPVLLAWGAEDRLLEVRPLEAPDVETVVLPGCGHVPMWDAPRLVADTIRHGVRRRSPHGPAALPRP